MFSNKCDLEEIAIKLTDKIVLLKKFIIEQYSINMPPVHWISN